MSKARKTREGMNQKRKRASLEMYMQTQVLWRDMNEVRSKKSKHTIPGNDLWGIKREQKCDGH
jgi:hypothetical protein